MIDNTNKYQYKSDMVSTPENKDYLANPNKIIPKKYTSLTKANPKQSNLLNE